MRKTVLILCLIQCIQGILGKKALWDWEKKSFSVKDQEIQDVLDILQEDDPDPWVSLIDNEEEDENPCESIHCGPGRQCNDGLCICVEECRPEVDPRRWVCSNANKTHYSDCDVYRNRCLCEDGSPHCLSEENRHLHVEYYGECRKLEECTEDELIDFPRRMREWLFSVLHDLSERHEISEHYQQLKTNRDKDAQSITNRWSVAAVWQWCDLDKHPQDNKVSRHELFPLRAPLHSLEHCISPFLDSCDEDGDHSVTVQEWANCLELPVEEFMDKCEALI